MCGCIYLSFNDTPTSEFYTLSLHDALPISMGAIVNGLSLSKLRAFGATFFIFSDYVRPAIRLSAIMELPTDRKSTRLNSSHTVISYAVFCLKKKNITTKAAHFI